MTWTTTCETYREFQRFLERDPDLVRVDGFLGGSRVSFTLAALLEERESFYVEGRRGDWKAHVFRGFERNARPLSYPVKLALTARDNPSRGGSESDDPPWKT